MTVKVSSREMWIAAAIVSLFASLVACEDCGGSDSYCCEDQALGCFTTDAPYDHLPLPCCYNDEDDVTYSLYTRASSASPDILRLSQPLSSTYDGGKRTVFISHGFGSDSKGFEPLKDAFLERDDLNVILIDWPSKRADYKRAASETRTVGKLTALVMGRLVQDAGARYDDMWCVGHSLGSHVCGHAGKYAAEKIGRITGLDPAGPSFEVPVFPPWDSTPLRLGLAPTDAKFVDVIHTDTVADIGTMNIEFGTVRPLGHLDFYMNGREEQPGCRNRRRRFQFFQDIGNMIMSELTNLIACSHSRATEYFIEAVKSDCFVAQLACTNETAMPDSCMSCDGDCPIMGYNAPGSGPNGMYIVNTAPTGPPFCLG